MHPPTFCTSIKVISSSSVTQPTSTHTCRLASHRTCTAKKRKRSVFSLNRSAGNRQLRCQAIVAELLAFVPGVCFDRQCQEAADRAFLIVTIVPLLGLLAAIVLRFRPASAEKLGDDQVLVRHLRTALPASLCALISHCKSPTASLYPADL